ncbi:MAG: chloride channel protein [Rhodospirillaceae bacterium]
MSGYGKVKGQVLAVVRHDNLILAVLAIVVGVAIGWAISGFRTAISLIQTVFYGDGGQNLATIAGGLPAWQIIAAPCVGGLLVGLFYRFVMPGGSPHGVAQVIDASALKSGRLSLWPGLAATLGSAASLGVGASVGREGPAVLLGATLSSWLGQRLNLGRPVVRTLLGCGGAAAVAASFNAPIAGALFAHEVIVGHYALNAFTPVVLSSIAATMVSRAIYGDYPAFIIPAFDVIEWIEFPAFALTGVACGLAAVMLMRGIAVLKKSGDSLSIPSWIRPALAGLAIGLIALQLPDILGVGYEQTDRALRNMYPLTTVLMLIAAKLVATTLCLGWGFGGGIFSPSLALGALVGVAIGTAATLVGQELSSGPAAYALVGMGSLAAAVLGAPISTTLIIFEMTGDYTLTIAVMVGVVSSTLVSSQLYGHKSFFLGQLSQAGIHLGGGQDVSGLKGTSAADFLAPKVATCVPETSIAEVQTMLHARNIGEVYVVDDSDQFLGVVAGSDVSEIRGEAADKPVKPLVHSAASLVTSTDTVEHAVQALLAAGMNRLPVVRSLEDRRLIGTVEARALLRAINLTLLEADAEASGRKTSDKTIFGKAPLR